ncbi:MAG: class I SAM-dependent methyltransferase [Phycisphaerae bacterium]|nr:class I SAM-dependent methyltransferase [Phycisphaerae bacterium]
MSGNESTLERGLNQSLHRSARNRSRSRNHEGTTERPARAHSSGLGGAPIVALPEPDLRLSQDAEWFLVKRDGEWQQVRFHDYAEIYKVHGLYEKIFYRILKCDSPTVVCNALHAELKREGVSPQTLRVFDCGAGNGMVGEQLKKMGVESVVGIDILPEAREAARRDRPSVYLDYFVMDLTAIAAGERQTLSNFRLNCLTCVAALGFEDIPVAAFAQAASLIEVGGWLAFNIKDEFVRDPAKSEFARLIRVAFENGVLEQKSSFRYVHRLATDGKPLEYVTIVARKRGELFSQIPNVTV